LRAAALLVLPVIFRPTKKDKPVVQQVCAPKDTTKTKWGSRAVNLVYRASSTHPKLRRCAKIALVVHFQLFSKERKSAIIAQQDTSNLRWVSSFVPVVEVGNTKTPRACRRARIAKWASTRRI